MRNQHKQRSKLFTGALALLAICVLGAGALWQLTEPNGDLSQYRCFALAFWQGSHAVSQFAACHGRLPSGSYPAFRVTPREYPPLALIPFSAPLLLGGEVNMTAYVAVFNLLMAACLIITVLLIARIWLNDMEHATATSLSTASPNQLMSSRAVRLYLLWLTLGATTIALVRFDALPALLTVAALTLARYAARIDLSSSPPSGLRPLGALRSRVHPSPDRKERTRSSRRILFASYGAYGAYALLAIGALLKLYPALFIPLLAIWEWRQQRRPANANRPASPWLMRWRWLGGPLLAAALTIGVQWAADLLAQTSGVPWLSVQSRRPPQIESTAAAFLWLGEVLQGRGGAIRAISVQRSLAFVEGPGQALGLVTEGLALLAIAWAAWGLATGAIPLLRGWAGALLALMGGATIFSPQYMIWALPLVALASAGYGILARSENLTPRLPLPQREGVVCASHQPGLAHTLLIASWTLACLCTTVIYSVGYLLAWPAHTGGLLALFMLFVLARDLLVWVCAAILLWPTPSQVISPQAAASA
ncbi:MAG TPA: hypothetical protein VKQ36_16120 [Ktedonobacterales bacterium]|nr:hypothetical protein [Ktedonobacterales bacterium]